MEAQTDLQSFLKESRLAVTQTQGREAAIAIAASA